MIANVGDKFVIEIGQIFENAGKTLYRMKGFNTLVFDEAGLLKLARLHEVNIKEALPFAVGDEIIIKGYYDYNTSAIVLESANSSITFITKDGVVDVLYAEEFKCATKTGRHYKTVDTLLDILEDVNNDSK